MKKLLLILLCLPIVVLAQQTYVPDDNFEAYLEANGMGNGVPNDDSVLTANINQITELNVSSQSIYDLTGIEDFFSLTELNCSYNSLDTLDLNNINNLIKLECEYNNLIFLDLVNNLQLTHLNCGMNEIEYLDLSNNNLLTYIHVGFQGSYSLIYLNLSGVSCQSQNYLNIIRFGGTCIQVDDVNCWNNLPNVYGFYPSMGHYYSLDCPLPLSVSEIKQNKKILKMVNLFGKEIKANNNEFLFYIYDDGTVEKRIVIE